MYWSPQPIRTMDPWRMSRGLYPCASESRMEWWVDFSVIGLDTTHRQVVFKALLTLHQMIRSGSTDQLLDHLVKADVMRLRSIGGQNFEGG